MAKDPEQKKATCIRCGGPTVSGHAVWNAPIRFKPEGASQFNRGTPLRAVACEKCGHVELLLDK
jgi:hypothetical protein